MLRREWESLQLWTSTIPWKVLPTLQSYQPLQSRSWHTPLPVETLNALPTGRGGRPELVLTAQLPLYPKKAMALWEVCQMCAGLYMRLHSSEML